MKHMIDTIAVIRRRIRFFLAFAMAVALSRSVLASVTTLSGICSFPAGGGTQDGNSWGIYDGVYIQGYDFAIPSWLHLTYTRSGGLIIEKITVDPNTTPYKRAVSVPVRWSNGRVTNLTYYTVEQAGLVVRNVTFHPNGGSCSVSRKSYVVGRSYSSLPTPVRSGYVFTGWRMGSPSGASVTSSSSVSTSSPVTLYATWARGTYKVAFKANGGKGKMKTQTFSYGKAAELRKNAFVRSGFVFAGWAVGKNGSVAYSNRQRVANLRSDGKTKVLYAVWAKKKYKVVFLPNGGSGSMSAQNMTYGKAAALRGNGFRRSGWTFAGWAKSKDQARRGTVVYRNKASVKNLVRNGKTVHLHAVWKKAPSPASGGSSSSSTSRSGGTVGGVNVTETSSYWLGQYSLYMTYYSSWANKAKMQESSVANAQAQVNRDPTSIMAAGALSAQQNLLKTYRQNAQEWYQKAQEARMKAALLSAQGK